MRHTYIVVAVILIACIAAVGTAGAQANKPTVPHAATGTAFTYQGQIDRNGTLFTGYGYHGMIVEYWDVLRGDTMQWSSRPYILGLIPDSGQPTLDYATIARKPSFLSSLVYRQHINRIKSVALSAKGSISPSR